jgi:hypothetical protein
MFINKNNHFYLEVFFERISRKWLHGQMVKWLSTHIESVP